MVLVVGVACGDGSDPTLGGTYRGQDLGGNPDFPAQWTLTLEQLADVGAPVSGSYSIQGIGLDNQGTVSGTFADPDLMLTLRPSDSSKCTYNLTATWSGRQIRATYLTSQCFVVAAGSVTLRK